MLTSWTHGVEKQLAIDIKQNFKESIVMRRRLAVLLQEEIEENRKSANALALYDSPNWAYQQADRVGYERAIRKFMQLITD